MEINAQSRNELMIQGFAGSPASWIILVVSSMTARFGKLWVSPFLIYFVDLPIAQLWTLGLVPAYRIFRFYLTIYLIFLALN
jgi:hypothetical protein